MATPAHNIANAAASAVNSAAVGQPSPRQAAVFLYAAIAAMIVVVTCQQ